jgi:hypothetical protein
MREEIERSLQILNDRLCDIEDGLEAMERKLMEVEEDTERRWEEIVNEIWRLRRKIFRIEKRDLKRESNITLSLVAVLMGGMMVFASLPMPPLLSTCWWGIILGITIGTAGVVGFLKEVKRK